MCVCVPVSESVSRAVCVCVFCLYVCLSADGWAGIIVGLGISVLACTSLFVLVLRHMFATTQKQMQLGYTPSPIQTKSVRIHVFVRVAVKVCDRVYALYSASVRVQQFYLCLFQTHTCANTHVCIYLPGAADASADRAVNSKQSGAHWRAGCPARRKTPIKC